MMPDHTVKSFDEELLAMDNRLAEMGGLAESLLDDAVNALVHRNPEMASEIAHRDQAIDSLEDEINELVVRLLALRQPMAADLRVVISALKISSDLERIGDYAKNVAKRVPAIVELSPTTPLSTISRMGALVQQMIRNVLDAYLARDGAKAKDVRNQDEQVDLLHTSLFRELLTYMMEDPRWITACTHLMFVAKNLERIGDHATNIAESVVFLVEGETPTDQRPKGDTTPSTTVR